MLLTADAALTGSDAAAAWLRSLGAEPGDRVVIAVPGSADVVTAVLGALRAGVIPVVLDPATPAAELADLVADADPVTVVDDPGLLASVVAGPAAVPDDLPELPLGRPMHYTSGTTGRRKGVWSGVLPEPDASRLWAEEAELWRMNSGDVHVVMSPLHHSAPLRFALVTLLAGGRVLLPGKFDVERFLAACERHPPTTTFTAPAQLVRLREAAARDPRDGTRVRTALGGLRLLAHAGAPCPEPVKRWVLDVLDADRVWEFYGSTEGQFTACSGSEWLDRPGTVGRARPGRRLDVDEDGRIWCVVPPYARFSYWRDPERTARTWRSTADGPAFTVGDAGHLDDDGYLYLLGRRDDLVITGGVNVYPAEVERVLAEMPGVTEVAVFGVDDDRWGQRVEAAVTGPVAADDVLAYAAAHLPPARRPKRVHVVGDLPRTSTGKIVRRSLPDLTT